MFILFINNYFYLLFFALFALIICLLLYSIRSSPTENIFPPLVLTSKKTKILKTVATKFGHTPLPLPTLR